MFLQGKSTLQNEIVGDLDAEFGGLPDDAENMTLLSLALTLDSGFSGQYGKSMSKLVSRLVSSKMPAGFNQAAIREYLSSHWGLGVGRQNTVICFAVAGEPASRLVDIASAKDFIDSVAIQYAKNAHMTISPSEQAGGAIASQSIATATNPASVEAVSKQEKEYLTKQFEVLAKYLDHDPSSKNEEVSELEAQNEASEERLELMREELEDEFTSGIEPRFDPAKARTYDSSWNWVRQDLISLLLEYRKLHRGGETEEFTRYLMGRWDSTCRDTINFFHSHTNIDSLLKTTKNWNFNAPPVYQYSRPTVSPKTTVDSAGKIKYEEIPREPVSGSNDYSRLVRHGRTLPNSCNRIPFLHLRHWNGEEWQYHQEGTDLLMDEITLGCSFGLSFSGKTVLITGAGPQSIGAEIVKGLLSGGADVIVTTSRSVSDAAKFYNSLYKDSGARDSRLTLLPFNQGSKKDCEALISHIYSNKSGLGTDLDFIIPFAAITESGREIDALDSKSELAHRLMLTNLIRLLGFVKQQKQRHNFDTWPTSVVLPLSPNHGTFGGDGLYGESKIALESLMSRWYSESWSEYLTIAGAVIGWTRGTGLMNANNILAESIESHNVITFSQSEMAFNILALMTPSIARLCEDGPVYADLNGGLQFLTGLKETLTSARKEIVDKSRIRKALLAERVRHEAVLGAADISDHTHTIKKFRKRANLDLGFPDLPTYQMTTVDLQSLEGMIDLNRVIVVVGFSELGPWGSARTRFEMEHAGELAMERYIEMAWMMGLVRHFTGDISGTPYTGWLDAKTQQPVHDDEFESRYRDEILGHSGIRFIEPEGLDGYDPAKKESLHEVIIDEDLPAFEASKNVAEAFRLRHGDKVKISPIADSEDYKVQIGKGVHFLVSKAAPFDRQVAGQLPKGWDPVTYGIPKDIISQVDPVTLYALCCLCQALLSAGIEDPYELYKHIHVSELANCLGSSVGGMVALRNVYRERYLDRPVQSDIVQESYINAIGAWTNMLLMGSAGPIKSQVGACASAIEALDVGCEAIQTGKAKVAIIGGADDFQEEMSTDFGNMRATASSDVQLDAGRIPSEMSRPMTTSRGGFVESAGCGVQLIMTAELALQMGLPIYAILAASQMAGDKIGRSVPAPGQGLLTAAREGQNAHTSPLLNLEFRKSNLHNAIKNIEEERKCKLSTSHQTSETINQTAECQIKDAQNIWFNDIRKQNPHIAPMRGALATWGLTVDDVQVASMHGTSTQANDKNESSVLHQQMTHLGRTAGNPLLAMSQKWLTGHPKGAAGAWMLNGCLQVLQTGIVPGNRNADNIGTELRQFTHLVYPSRTIHISAGVKAFMLTSFGFGQKGGLVIGIAPKYLYSAISEEAYERYRSRVQVRQQKANNAFIEGIMNNSLFRAKTSSAWDSVGEARVFLDTQARVSLDGENGYRFDREDMHPDHSNEKAPSEMSSTQRM